MTGINRSAQTAETLILVGLILYLVGDVILLLVGLLFLFLVFVGIVVLTFAALGFVWVALIWQFSYARVRSGDYDGARTPTIVFAILSLITLGLVPGILFLIAFVKLEDASRERVGFAERWSVFLCEPRTPNPEPRLLREPRIPEFRQEAQAQVHHVAEGD